MSFFSSISVLDPRPLSPDFANAEKILRFVGVLCFCSDFILYQVPSIVEECPINNSSLGLGEPERRKKKMVGGGGVVPVERYLVLRDVTGG